MINAITVDGSSLQIIGNNAYSPLKEESKDIFYLSHNNKQVKVHGPINVIGNQYIVAYSPKLSSNKSPKSLNGSFYPDFTRAGQWIEIKPNESKIYSLDLELLHEDTGTFLGPINASIGSPWVKVDESCKTIQLVALTNGTCPIYEKTFDYLVTKAKILHEPYYKKSSESSNSIVDLLVISKNTRPYLYLELENETRTNKLFFGRGILLEDYLKTTEDRVKFVKKKLNDDTLNPFEYIEGYH